MIAASGSLATRSGDKTGRSPKDKRIVDDPASRVLVCERRAEEGLNLQGGAKLANVPAAASLDYTFKPAKDAPNATNAV